MYPTNSFFRFIRLCVFESRDHKPSNSSRIYIRTFIVFGIYRLHSIVPVKQSEVPVCRRHAHFYQHKDFKEIDYGLSKEISNVCKWFVDKKLSVHFGEDKIKYIFFSRQKDLPELNKTYNNNRIQKIHITEYRGCYLDAILSGESIAVKYLKRIITQLQFFYRQNKFLNPKLHRLLCNSAVQPLCLCMYFLVPFVSQKIRKKTGFSKINVSIFA